MLHVLKRTKIQHHTSIHGPANYKVFKNHITIKFGLDLFCVNPHDHHIYSAPQQRFIDVNRYIIDSSKPTSPEDEHNRAIIWIDNKALEDNQMKGEDVTNKKHRIIWSLLIPKKWVKKLDSSCVSEIVENAISSVCEYFSNYAITTKPIQNHDDLETYHPQQWITSKFEDSLPVKQKTRIALAMCHRKIQYQDKAKVFDIFDSETNYNALWTSSQGPSTPADIVTTISGLIQEQDKIHVFYTGNDTKYLEYFQTNTNLKTLNNNNPANPFGDIYPEQYASVRELLIHTLETLALQNTPKLLDEQKGKLAFALELAYSKKGVNLELKDIYNAIHHDDADLKSLIEVYSVGKYAKYFHGPNKSEHGNIELNNIKDDSEVSICRFTALLCKVAIDAKRNNTKKIKQYIVLSDAWKLINKTNMSIYEKLLQFAKRYKICIITQVINDKLISRTSTAFYALSMKSCHIIDKSNKEESMHFCERVAPDNVHKKLSDIAQNLYVSNDGKTKQHLVSFNRNYGLLTTKQG